MLSNRDTLARLKFIGKIQASEKLSLRDMKTQSDDFFTTIWRTIFRDSNRSRTLSFLNDVIDKSFEIISNYKTSDKKSDITIVHNIVHDLANCKEGLKNLRETYANDRKFCCDIDLLQQTVDARLSEYSGMLSKPEPKAPLSPPPPPPPSIS